MSADANKQKQRALAESLSIQNELKTARDAYQSQSFYTGGKTNPITSSTQSTQSKIFIIASLKIDFPTPAHRPTLWVSEKTV